MVAGAGAGRASTHDEERRCNVLTKQEGSSLGPQATPALAKAARAPCSPPASPPAHRNSRELSWENSQLAPVLSVENSKLLQEPLLTHLICGLNLDLSVTKKRRLPSFCPAWEQQYLLVFDCSKMAATRLDLSAETQETASPS